MAFAVLAAVALVLAASAGWAGYRWLAGKGPQREFTSFQHLRMGTIQAQLDQVEGPYILLMGDSHAERLYLPSLCGLPVVNAGISGATVGDLVDVAQTIAPRHAADALLLSVGTNDIWVKRNPGTKEAEDRFRAGLAALGKFLDAWSGRRALIAIPPVASEEEALFPRPAALRYSSILAQSCERDGCVYLDLFAEAGLSREPRLGFSDGVHLRDYAHFVRTREAQLCSRLGLVAPASVAAKRSAEP